MLEHPLPILLVRQVVTVEVGGPLDVVVAELEVVEGVVVLAAGVAQYCTIPPARGVASVEHVRPGQQPL